MGSLRPASGGQRRPVVVESSIAYSKTRRLQRYESPGIYCTAKKTAKQTLENMLMGQEADVGGKAFLKGRAREYLEKSPEAMEALLAMENIYILI